MEGENLKGKSRNAETFQALGGFWYKNAADNRHRITELLESGRARPIHESDKVLYESPATVVGTGPSLDELDLEALVHPVFSSTTALSVFFRGGIQVEYASAIDSNPTLWPKLSPMIDLCKDITLITHPCIAPEFLQYWPGPILLFRPGQAKHPFFDHILPHMYPEIKVCFMNVGCVVNGLIEYANYLGYGPFYLAGVDLGYSHKKYRATTYTPTVTTDGMEWAALPAEPPPPDGLRIANNGIRTTEEMIAYKLNLYLVMHLDQSKLIRLLPKQGMDTILYELPAFYQDDPYSDLDIFKIDYDKIALDYFTNVQGLDLREASDGSGAMFVKKPTTTVTPTIAEKKDA